MAYLEWTVRLRTDTGALFCEADIRAEISPDSIGPRLTGDISIDGVEVEDTIDGHHGWHPLTGPLLGLVMDALSNNPAFEDHAWDAIVEHGEVSNRPNPDARAAWEESSAYRSCAA